MDHSARGQERLPRSNRFLTPEEMARGSTPEQQRGHAGTHGRQLFAEGQWQVIRGQLEREGWDPSQIERIHDQLHQGWSLHLARRNVSLLSGRCPLSARGDY
jgi:hypothetical protein